MNTYFCSHCLTHAPAVASGSRPAAHKCPHGRRCGGANTSTSQACDGCAHARASAAQANEVQLVPSLPLLGLRPGQIDPATRWQRSWGARPAVRVGDGTYHDLRLR